MLTLTIPTYYPSGARKDKGVSPAPPQREYDDPQVSLILSSEEGLRIKLARSQEKITDDIPSLVIERRKYGWMIFVQIEGDDIGCLQLRDDQKACLVRDKFVQTPLRTPAPGKPGLDLD